MSCCVCSFLSHNEALSYICLPFPKLKQNIRNIPCLCPKKSPRLSNPCVLPLLYRPFHLTEKEPEVSSSGFCMRFFGVFPRHALLQPSQPRPLRARSPPDLPQSCAFLSCRRLHRHQCQWNRHNQQRSPHPLRGHSPPQRGWTPPHRPPPPGVVLPRSNLSSRGTV